jgi:hypothetical protein
MAPWEDAAPREDAAPSRSRRSRTKTVIGLTAVTAVTATISAAAGGLIGGYVGYRAASPQRDVSTYTLTPAPAASSKRPAASMADIAARALPGVVMIKVDGGQCIGSGFVVSGGYIITNNHVVTMDGEVRQGRATLRVIFNSGKSAPAKLIAADPYSDIAIIQAKTNINLTALPLGNSGTVDVGDPVMAVGSPLGLNGTVTSGIVSALNRPVQPGGTSGTSPASRPPAQMACSRPSGPTNQASMSMSCSNDREQGARPSSPSDRPSPSGQSPGTQPRTSHGRRQGGLEWTCRHDAARDWPPWPENPITEIRACSTCPPSSCWS